MQQIQLYIGNQRIDMFKDESVSITDTIKDVKDISKIFTEYSQTFEIPASKINNKVFSHYYDNDIVGGFDARVRAPSFIELNSAPFKKGFIKLEGIDLKNNIAHTYRITFFGNTVSLKRLLGDDKLTDLRWLDNFNTRNNGADIRYVSEDIEYYLTAKHNKTFGGVTYDNPVQVPLVTHTERLYYNSAQNDANTGNLHYSTADTSIKKGVKWTELKYALKLTAIIDAIQAPIAEGGYGITFSDDFFNNSTNLAFNNLTMWLHRIRGQATSGGQEVSTTTQPTGWTNSNSGSAYMTDNIYSHIGDADINSVRLTPSNTDTYSYQVFRSEISFINGQVETTAFSVIHSSGNVTGFDSFIFPNFTSAPVISARYYIEITSTTQINFTTIVFQNVNAFFGTTNFTLSNYLKTVVFNLVMTQQLPKMKVLDFLTSIFNMFSLVAYFEDDILVVESLDDFYNTGRGGSLNSEAGYDITQYVDVTKKTVDVALPFREVKYSYSGLKTFLAAQHEQLFNEEWGTEEYTGEDTAILSEEIFKVTIPFEHMKFEKLIDVTTSATQNILWGYFVDDSQRPYIGQPAIFNTVLLLGNISFVSEVDFEGVPLQYKQLTSYQVPSNSNMNTQSAGQPQPTINFAPEIDEYNFQQNNATLFKDFHKNYISGVFAESNRLTIVKAFLPLKILLKYNLNDRFIISGKSYKINSIETNLYTGQSDIELLKDVFPAYVAPEVVNFIAAENGDNLTAENGDFLITEQ